MKFKNILIAGAAVCYCVISFTACNDEETYDIDGIDHERIYMANPGSVTTGTVVSTPVGTIAAASDQFQVKVTKAPSTDIHVTLAIDNSKVAEYNDANGTSYLEASSNAFDLENASLTIRADSTLSTDTFRISIKDEAKEQFTDTENGYLVPVVITGSDSKDYQASTNASIRYLCISVKESAINTEATEIPGTELSIDELNAFKVIAVTNLNFSQEEYEDMNTGVTYDYGSWGTYHYDGKWWMLDTSNPSASFTLNLQQSLKITAIKMGSSYLTNMQIEISDDGNTWTDCGEVTTDEMCYIDYSHRAAVFYGAMPAKYLRVTITKSFTYSWYASYYGNVTGFGVYTN